VIEPACGLIGNAASADGRCGYFAPCCLNRSVTAKGSGLAISRHALASGYRGGTEAIAQTADPEIKQ
jgi:hypothetical protein